MAIIDLHNASVNCGGKAFGLSKLIKLGINVPQGFVIQDSNNINNNELELLRKKLKKFDKDDQLAIRSSANAEDGEKSSYAGVFDTILNVKNNFNEIIKSINKVNESKNTNIVGSYSNKNDIIMNIIIQKMINSRISGICFTNAIDIDGNKAIMIEYVEGLGEKLVSGKTNSNKIIIKYKNNKLDLENCRLEGVLNNFNGFDKLINMIEIAIDSFDYALDIEWCIDENDIPYLVQARPVTKDIFINDYSLNSTNNTIVVSRGCIEGSTYVIDSNLDYNQVKKLIDNFPQGKILVANYTETYYLPAMKKAIGIITDTGSSLCHAAIVARELNIPCIVGCKDATKKFPTGTIIKLDATNNTIISDKHNENISNDFQLDFGNLDCFDNYITIVIDNIKIFIEFTFDGLIVHMPDETSTLTINKIEYFIRKNFHRVPKYCSDENKYLWIKEIERFKQLPKFSIYLEHIKKASKDFDEISLLKIQEELINNVKLLVISKKTCDDSVKKFFIDEMIASINELLDGIIPFGYPLYESYVQALPILEQENITYNDLFNTNLVVNNNKLSKIKKFLKIVSKIKDESYQKVWDIGGTDPDYFEKRDIIINNFLIQNKINIDDEIMNVFYEKYLKQNFNFLDKIISSNE